MSYIKTILSALKARFAKKEDVDNISEGIDYAFNDIDNLHEKLDTKMNRRNPSGTGSFSLNRNSNTPIGKDSHAEGYDATASGEDSHAEGNSTTASGIFSHAEGVFTIASGAYSHAEGYNTIASGLGSHAEGNSTTASGNNSHAEGYFTTASGNFQHVHGKYNVSDTQGKYADIVGWGTSSTTSKRKNISALETNGTLHLAGNVYTNANKDSTGGNKLATETYVDDSLEDKQDVISDLDDIRNGAELGATAVQPEDIPQTEQATEVSIDTVVTEGSENPVSSGAVFAVVGDVETALDAINDRLEAIL